MITTITTLSCVAISLIISTCHTVPPGHRPSQLEIDDVQMTPLLDAVGKQEVETVRTLIASGADVNKSSLSQAPPLNVAVAHTNPSLPVIIELLRGGAHVDWNAHFSVPHPNPSPESSPRRSPVGSDSEAPTPPRSPIGSDSEYPSSELSSQTVRMHIKMPLQIAAEKRNIPLVQELYRRGAYPLPQGVRDSLSRPARQILNQHEGIAQGRVRVVHGVLDKLLKGATDLEKIIREMEFGSQTEGYKYYWHIVAHSSSAMPRTTAEAGPPKGAGAANTVSS